MVEFAAFIFLLLTSPIWISLGIRLVMALFQPILILLVSATGLIIAFNFPNFTVGLSCVASVFFVIRGIHRKLAKPHKIHEKHSHDDFIDQLLG